LASWPTKASSSALNISNILASNQASKAGSEGLASPKDQTIALEELTIEESNVPESALPVLKLFSAGFLFFVAGANDGSIGALIPYMLESYQIWT
jgi:hypothetical protein